MFPYGTLIYYLLSCYIRIPFVCSYDEVWEYIMLYSMILYGIRRCSYAVLLYSVLIILWFYHLIFRYILIYFHVIYSRIIFHIRSWSPLLYYMVFFFIVLISAVYNSAVSHYVSYVVSLCSFLLQHIICYSIRVLSCAVHFKSNSTIT